MITEMSKVQIVGLRSQKPQLISLLHNLGVLQIELTPLSKVFEQQGLTYMSLAEKEEHERAIIEETLKKIQELLSCLKAPCTENISELSSRLEKLTSSDIQVQANNIDKRMKSILEEKNILKAEMLILPQYKKIIEAFLKTDYDLSKYENLGCIALVFPSKFVDRLKGFQELIEAKIKHKIDIYLSDFDAKKAVCLVFYEKRFSQDIDEEIFKRGTQKFTLPQQYLLCPLKESIKLIEERLKTIQQRQVDCDQQIEALAKENYCFLYAASFILKDRLDELIYQQNFVVSKYTITITGWLPKQKFNQAKDALEKEFGYKIIFQDVTKTIKRREEIPILLDNPEAVKPFELLLSLLQPPKYGTFDPTKSLSIFFPIFFGLIVGDIGYGLILLIVSLFLRRAKKTFLKTISKLVSYVSVSSIVFGILFGEFFGELGSHILGLHPILFHRQKDIVPFLILSISLGVFHILLGLVLGVIQAVKQKHRNEILEKGSIILSLFGLFFLVAAFSKLLPGGFFTPSVALLTISLSVLILVKGFIGPLEAISTVANILSYARIMALGLAGVIMAHIANTLGSLTGDIILGIIVASLIHILNLILSVFSPTIQSLRLHYVEFFPKFYETGGKQYKPFKKGNQILCIP